MGRIARSAAVAVALSLAAAAPAVSAAPTIKASPNPVQRGKTVRAYGVVMGCGGLPASQAQAVTLISRAFPHTHDFAGLPAVIAPRKPDGSYSVRVRIPSTRRPGTYSISGRCGGGNLGVSRKLHVTA